LVEHLGALVGARLTVAGTTIKEKLAIKIIFGGE
jgi:hypothetical protein